MSPPADDLRRGLDEPLTHPDADARRQDAGRVVEWVLRHWGSLPEQRIGQAASRAEMERRLHEPPPERGQDLGAVLAEFERQVTPFAFRTNHPRFLAFVPGAPSFPSVLGDWLCSGVNFFAGVWLEAPGPAEVELVVLDWFRQLLGLPEGTGGILTSGGSEANLTALLVAREGLTFVERGRAVLYVAAQRHGSVDRAAKVIGLRPDQIRAVADDIDFRMRPDALVEAVRQDRAAGLRPWAAVANAGATNTGTVDPLVALANVCAGERLWFHVDAAYGWPAVLTAEGRVVLAGVGRADSITLDPHKWFGQTFDAGCVLVREGRRLEATFAYRPDYMQDVAPEGDEVSFADRGLALTRRFRALKIWFSVKVLGLAWFRALVERCCRLAAFGEALLREVPDFEIVCPQRLSIVCFRYAPPGRDGAELDRLNLELVERLRATGRAFLSSTRLRGRVALRFCFVNWRTTAGDVEEVVRLLRELAGGGH